MADEPKGAAAPAEAPAGKRKLPLKTILVLGAVLGIEAGAISTAFLVAGRPADAKAEHAVEQAEAAADGEKTVTEQVVADKFQNTRSGRTYLYDTEIYVVIKKKNQPRVAEDLEAKTPQVVADIALIFRRAEPAHLLEPTLATLTRQIRAALDERLGKDSEGKSYIEDVLIKKFTQYRADG
jgi:flagellar basal body-associated protein FliL